MKIYTRTGDKGKTGLFDGTRVSKADVRVEAYGAVDETSALLGVAAANTTDVELQGILQDLQRDLFAVGAQLADPKWGVKARKEKTRLNESRVAELEALIDRAEAELPPLKRFILPGGSPAGAVLHLARTVCRRAERRIVALAATVTVSPVLLAYVNRLSDLLFVLARLASRRAGTEEIPW
ncbi:MAG: cob(I)yrinic acid a,c-diamide adenosyltransferase [candidate division NC10 bacterium]|nr:cob(I)yrinic acid a,c-diamide adenosyltransferase [candidate division NC10 bacterium]MBI4391564.1 cob(I)yrinic acid a,c-diamide adenosyltransferase [candidate division NC10 bacterium]